MPKTHNDKLISTKEHKESHGFGTKSIQKVVNKYHGELQWEYNSEIDIKLLEESLTIEEKCKIIIKYIEEKKYGN